MSDESPANELPWVEVPWQQVAADTLDNLVAEFVHREGTDYGESEVPLARKVAQVHEQLRRGEVLILFDPASETVNLVTRAQWRELLRGQPTPD